MEVKFKRIGQDVFIVEYLKKYYLVDIIKNKNIKAKPSNSPQMFLKQGYFEKVESVSIAKIEKIRDIITNK